MSATAHRSRGRAALAGVAVAALLAGGSAAAQPAFAASSHPSAPKAVKAHDKLGSSDRDKLATARAKGARTVTAMIVTSKGSTTSVRKQIEKAGGYVRYENSSLGYLSAAIPTGSLEKTAALDAVTAIDLDEVVPMPKDSVSAAAQATGTYSGPSASTPDANPYLPTKDTGSAAFKAQHKAWDGRGVTIGILDSGIDLDSAPLRTTTTPGEEKVSDWFTATDPVTEGSLVSGGDASWLPMLQDATGPAVSYAGYAWTLPAGTFKIAVLQEARLNLAGCELCDANRDGDRTDRIGVLYEPSTHKIWVDTNDDKSFLDETAMAPYKSSHQVGHIGVDKPATEIHESIPFVVDYREHVDYTVIGAPAAWKDLTAVDIGIASGEHGSHVAGIAAGHALFGGTMNGQAPGAKLVSARACNFGTGCTAAALTDGMAKLASDGVDIINMSIGGLPALNDGDNARAALYNAIIASGVQIVLSAGNSSNAFNTIGDPAVASDVVAVGADITKETWAANYGSGVDFTQGIMPFSSGGPREDGGFKPDITAPGAAIATTPMWLPGSPVAEAGYSLPVGYSMLQGTSMASPEAAGSMALLISAAKQEGVTDRSPAALRRAVYSSAQWTDGVPAYLQGRGQIDVPGAWELLRMGLDASTITTSAPVCTEIWKILGRSTGTGLYNRCTAADGGQTAGSSKAYKVTLTRTTGKAKSGTYALSFKGNDGTFSVSPSSVALPLNTAVDVTVTATPTTAGGHTASLFIDDPKTKGLDGSMMAAVAAGETFSAPSWSVTHSGTAKRNVAKSYFVTVPAGVKALELDLTGIDDANKSQTRFLAFHPYGVNVGDTSTPVCYTNYPTTANEGNGCNPRSRAIANPQPGVWEVLVESRRTSPLQDNPYTLTAKLLGAKVDPQTVTLDSVTANVPSPVSWHLVNQYAGVSAHAVGGPLGSARVQHPTINQDEDQTFTVTVPSGASRLDVRIGNPGDTAADLDLFVTGPGGPKQSADGDSEESVSYVNPAAGTYTIRINGYSVPTANMSYDYLDVFYASALGSVDVDAAPFEFPGGATHDVTGSVTAKSSPAAGRTLSGQMNVLSESGAVIGTGEVRIGSVG